MNLAAFIMDLLWKGFPNAMDKREPEIGRISGPKPVMFLDCDKDSLFPGSSNTQSKDKTKLSSRPAEFGAEQVILVLDEESKSSLREKLGDVGLILTVLQAKGMEFADVFLWNFFNGDRGAEIGRSLLALHATSTSKHYDSVTNFKLCGELKILYVAG